MSSVSREWRDSETSAGSGLCHGRQEGHGALETRRSPVHSPSLLHRVTSDRSAARCLGNCRPPLSGHSSQHLTLGLSVRWSLPGGSFMGRFLGASLRRLHPWAPADERAASRARVCALSPHSSGVRLPPALPLRKPVAACSRSAARFAVACLSAGLPPVFWPVLPRGPPFL